MLGAFPLGLLPLSVPLVEVDEDTEETITLLMTVRLLDTTPRLALRDTTPRLVALNTTPRLTGRDTTPRIRVLT